MAMKNKACENVATPLPGAGWELPDVDPSRAIGGFLLIEADRVSVIPFSAIQYVLAGDGPALTSDHFNNMTQQELRYLWESRVEIEELPNL
jgi:hypothetical protein